MGIIDSIKNAAIAARCLTGLHSGDFFNIQGKPKCYMVKTCIDCNKRIEKIEHKFGDWSFVKDKQCDAKRSCIYCNEEEKKIAHQWEKEDYDEKSLIRSCDMYKTCKRCFQREYVRTQHGPWFGSVGHPDGTQTFSCERCGKNERRKFDPSA